MLNAHTEMKIHWYGWLDLSGTTEYRYAEVKNGVFGTSIILHGNITGPVTAYLANSTLFAHLNHSANVEKYFLEHIACHEDGRAHRPVYIFSTPPKTCTEVLLAVGLVTRPLSDTYVSRGASEWQF